MSMSDTVQQRRSCSRVANTYCNVESWASSQEDRNLDLRQTKERRGWKQLKRFRRRTKLRRILWGWKCDPHVRIAICSFCVFSLIGIATFNLTHESSRDGGARMEPTSHKKFEHKQDEYDSDNHKGRSLLAKLRGSPDYVMHDSMKKVGSKSKWYADLRQEYDTGILPRDDERSLRFVEAERKRQGVYKQSPESQTPYDIINCPDHPPEGYPLQWPVLDVLRNWPADEQHEHTDIYQGLCVFDYRTELHKAENYRRKELPFVVRNDPAVARTAERWNHPGYMENVLMGKEDTLRRTEYSPDNHFMYWDINRIRKQRLQKDDGGEIHGGFGRGNQEDMMDAINVLEELNELKSKLEDARIYFEHHESDEKARSEVVMLQSKVAKAKLEAQEAVDRSWKPPTEILRMTYLDWLGHANVTDEKLGKDNPHWYFQLMGCGTKQGGSCDKASSEWLFDELTFFQPRTGKERPFYLIEPKLQKGIHCRFGMKGVIAENHFDLSRNAIVLLGGRRRYILAHPNQCNNMNLLPRGHPSARHSAVDWSDADLENFPTFGKARVNEIVMQPGDVLYLPTNWFHYIISLELNMQCNTRSGGEYLYREEIHKCGF